MSIVFYKEIGFSKGQIAIYSKGLGWITTVVFTLLGGIMAIIPPNKVNTTVVIQPSPFE